jgi:hypothetical protein
MSTINREKNEIEIYRFPEEALDFSLDLARDRP